MKFFSEMKQNRTIKEFGKVSKFKESEKASKPEISEI